MTGNTLAIADGNSVDLSAYVDTDTDDQTLSLTGNTLAIADGNSVDLSGYVDTDTDDQTLSLTGTDLTIADGNTIDIQYGTPAVVSTGAPATIPTYANNELYYYVTYYDPTVFANVSVDAVGEMTYDVIATPTDYNTLINVVFVAQ